MNPNRRDFLLTTAAGAIGATGAFGAARTDMSWTRKPGRIYFYDQYALNEQPSAFSKYNPDRITEELLATGADIIVIYCSNQFSIAYYPSKILPQHPNLKGRDYVGDLFSRLRRHGKKLGAYINWMDSVDANWLTLPAPERGEAKRMDYPSVSWTNPVNPQRRIQKIPGGVRRNPCFNSPRGKQMLEVGRELVERYHPDIFCMDAFHVVYDNCICQYCRPTLEKMFGTKELTQQVFSKHWPRYIDWKMEQCAAVVKDLSAMLRAKGVVTFHNAGIPLPVRAAGGAGEEWIPELDVMLLEGFQNLDLIATTIRTCASLGKPLWQLFTSSWPNYAHVSVAPAWWRAVAATCKSNGVEVLGPCGIGAWPDTTTLSAIYSAVKTGFEEFMRDADLTNGSTSAAKIGLMFSWNCRKYFPDVGVPASPSGTPQEWSQELLGWSRMLLRQHLPFDIPIVEQIQSASQIANYDLIILPGLEYLSDTFCAALADYVRDGGRVLATAATSLGTETGLARPDFALGTLLGIARKGSFAGDFALEAPGEPVTASGALQQVLASGTVVARMVTLDPAGSVKGRRDPMPMGPSEWPVLTRSTHGKGATAYVAFDAGAMHLATGLRHMEDFMMRAVDALLEKKQIQVTAPYSVEVCVRTQKSPKRTIVHLANRTHAPWDMTKVTGLLPVQDIEITLPAGFSRGRVECRGGSIRTRSANGKLTIQLARLDAHAAIVFS